MRRYWGECSNTAYPIHNPATRQIIADKACVARTYMAKMGGTVEAHNSADGVEFVLTLAVALGIS